MVKRLISAEEIIESISEDCRVQGSGGVKVTGAHPLDRADEDSVCFCSLKGEQALQKIRQSKSKLIICSDKIEIPQNGYEDQTLIQVVNPRLVFGRVLTRYFIKARPRGIHPTAIVDPNAVIGNEVSIGPYSCIGECEIGAGSMIAERVHIESGTKIGKRVIISTGVVIGGESLSFTKNADCEMEKFPQLGSVIIEDDVQIGANTVVQRGPLPRSNTIIGKGTKVAALVTVSHGVQIGKHCIIVGQTNICGHAKVGDYTQLSASVRVKEGINIGSRVVVGMGAIVIRDVPDDLVVVGNPARPLRINEPALTD